MKTVLSKILGVVVMVLVCQCSWGATLTVGTPVLVPGWNPNPNDNQILSYISPQADFMLSRNAKRFV